MMSITTRCRLPVLTCVLAFLATAPQAEDLDDTLSFSDWQGQQKFKGSLKGIGKIKFEEAASLRIDDCTFVFGEEEDDIRGSFVRNGKKIEALVMTDSLDDIEAGLASIIVDEARAAGIPIGATEVTIDADDIRVKVKFKSSNKKGEFVRVTFKTRYEAQVTGFGRRRGKVTIKALLFRNA